MESLLDNNGKITVDKDAFPGLHKLLSVMSLPYHLDDSSKSTVVHNLPMAPALKVGYKEYRSFDLILEFALFIHQQISR